MCGCDVTDTACCKVDATKHHSGMPWGWQRGLPWSPSAFLPAALGPPSPPLAHLPPPCPAPTTCSPFPHPCTGLESDVPTVGAVAVEEGGWVGAPCQATTDACLPAAALVVAGSACAHTDQLHIHHRHHPSWSPHGDGASTCSSMLITHRTSHVTRHAPHVTPPQVPLPAV